MRKWIGVAVIGLSVSGLVFCAEEAGKPPAKPKVIGPKPAVRFKPLKPPLRAPLSKGKVLAKSDLLPFIPAPPKGWKAEKPSGKTGRAGAFASTRVRRVFKKGNEQITFILEDLGPHNPYFSMKEPLKIVQKKTSQGYSKKLMLGKLAAQEVFNTKRKQGVVFTVLEKRIQLNVAGKGIEDTSLLVKLAKTVDLKKLKKVLDEKSKKALEPGSGVPTGR